MTNNRKTYAETAAAAREAASRVYIAATGNASALWDVRIDAGESAYMARDTAYGETFRLGLPSWKGETVLTQPDADAVTGFWLHEVSHAIWTDYAVWKKACELNLAKIVNGLEDVRIEYRLLQSGFAPGARSYIGALFGRMVDRALSQGWNGTDPNNIPWTLAAEGRRRFLPYGVQFNLKLEGAEKALLDETMARLSALLDNGTTQDVLDLAIWFRDQLPKSGKTTQPEDGRGKRGEGERGNGEKTEGETERGESGEGENAEDETETQRGESGEGETAEDAEGENAEDENESGEGWNAEDAEGNNPGKGEGEKTEGETERGENETQSGEGGEGAGRGEGWKGADVESMADGEPNLDDITERMKKNGNMQEDAEDRAFSDYLVLLSGDYFRGRQIQLPEGKPRLRKEYKDAIAKAARLRKDMADLVSSPDDVAKASRLSAGRFDRRARERMDMGREDLFFRRTIAEGERAAVSFLIDNSGSMAGHKQENAAILALVMGDALSRANVPFSISFFDNRLHKYKGFNDTWNKYRDALPKVFTCGGGTDIAPNVHVAAQDLAKVQNVTRRVLIVLTDGMDAAPPRLNETVARMARARGVEIIGLAMGRGAAIERALTPDMVSVVRAADILTEGLGPIVRTLKARWHGGRAAA